MIYIPIWLCGVSGGHDGAEELLEELCDGVVLLLAEGRAQLLAVLNGVQGLNPAQNVEEGLLLKVPFN